MKNLHRITGATFHHAHPECATCAHFTTIPPESWFRGYEGHCVEKQRILCCAKSRPCADWTAPAATDKETKDE